MTDIAVTTQEYLPADRPWLLFEAVGHFGPVPTDAGLINFALFTLATHYPNGFINNGVSVGRVTTGGRLGPYDNAATDGRQTCIGFLFNAITVPTTDLVRKVSVAFVDCFAVVSRSRLPVGHGLDAAAEAELPRIHFRA